EPASLGKLSVSMETRKSMPCRKLGYGGSSPDGHEIQDDDQATNTCCHECLEDLVEIFLPPHLDPLCPDAHRFGCALVRREMLIRASHCQGPVLTAVRITDLALCSSGEPVEDADSHFRSCSVPALCAANF